MFFNRASSPSQTRLALKLAQFLTNSAQQRKSLAALPFAIPVNKHVLVDPRLYPLQATLRDQSRSGVVRSLTQIQNLEVKREDLDLLYQKVLGGQISPDEAAVELTRTLNAPIEAKPSGDDK